MASGLTLRQQRYVEAFMGTAQGVAVRAAEMAGYANPASAANKLKRHPKILAAIDQRVASSPEVWGREELQRFWTEIASGKENPFLDMKDRLKASELLGKSQGLFIDRHEHTVGGQVLVGGRPLFEVPSNGRELDAAGQPLLAAPDDVVDVDYDEIIDSALGGDGDGA